MFVYFQMFETNWKTAPTWTVKNGGGGHTPQQRFGPISCHQACGLSRLVKLLRCVRAADTPPTAPPSP